MPSIAFGTKAETLERLEPALKSARVLPQVQATSSFWRQNPKAVFDAARRKGWLDRPLIVRSSAKAEDSSSDSLAGHFESIPNVYGEKALREAIERVVTSLGHPNSEDQFFIQPMLTQVVVSGVAFSRDLNAGGPYVVVNYDDTSGSTSSVTSGTCNDTKSFVYHKLANNPPEGFLGQVISLIDEIESLFDHDSFDMEFAVDEDGVLYLLQVRPLMIRTELLISSQEHRAAVERIAGKIAQLNRPHPYLLGSRTMFGVMPDWNPAEIIGVRPRPLALSLYRELVTDSVWAYQRDNYGYRNLRSFPLLMDFHGLPYVDVRVTFNSFVPREIDEGLAGRLVNYYLDRLADNPELHDKVEFEIIFSCYTLDLPDRLAALRQHGFSEEDCTRLAESLLSLTNRIIHMKSGLWRSDLERIQELEKRQIRIMGSDQDLVSRIYWLLEDCKRYGTLPFAGLARAGFIAVQLLRSMVTVGVLGQQEYNAFMMSLETVGSRMTRDFATLNRETFLQRYGHLRPGTYDIRSPRYDEAPDFYFDWSSRNKKSKERPEQFAPSLPQLNRVECLLKEHGLEHNALELFDFLKAGIEGREHSKFVFTRSLSNAISLFKELGVEYGFSADDCAYADIGIIRELYISTRDPKNLLGQSIESGRRRYNLTKHLILPSLIVNADDVWAFHMPRYEPNYVTDKAAVGHVTTDDDDRSALHGSILLISSADPGFDWIFSCDIAGFITKYGGANSHMAIRAGELGIPAVTGAGETLFAQWLEAQTLQIDCANRQVVVLK